MNIIIEYYYYFIHLLFFFASIPFHLIILPSTISTRATFHSRESSSSKKKKNKSYIFFLFSFVRYAHARPSHPHAIRRVPAITRPAAVACRIMRYFPHRHGSSQKSSSSRWTNASSTVQNVSAGSFLFRSFLQGDPNDMVRNFCFYFTTTKFTPCPRLATRFKKIN